MSRRESRIQLRSAWSRASRATFSDTTPATAPPISAPARPDAAETYALTSPKYQTLTLIPLPFRRTRGSPISPQSCRPLGLLASTPRRPHREADPPTPHLTMGPCDVAFGLTFITALALSKRNGNHAS